MSEDAPPCKTRHPGLSNAEGLPQSIFKMDLCIFPHSCWRRPPLSCARNRDTRSSPAASAFAGGMCASCSCGEMAERLMALVLKTGVCGAYRGFESHSLLHFAGIAQLAERLTCNQQVAGSIPVTSPNKTSYRRMIREAGRTKCRTARPCSLERLKKTRTGDLGR